MKWKFTDGDVIGYVIPVISVNFNLVGSWIYKLK